jgi:hypothetical protein
MMIVIARRMGVAPWVRQLESVGTTGSALTLAPYRGTLYIGVDDSPSSSFLSSSSTSVFRIVVISGEPTRHESQQSPMATTSNVTTTTVFLLVADRKCVT